MTHTLRDKESTMLRMLGGTPYSRQIMHCLLSRGQRLISDNQSFSHEPIPCPQLPHYMRPTEQTHYSWALSLIQYLQISQSNIHTTHLFPLPNASQTCTQTPIHTYYNINDDAPLTLDDIRDFEASYHLYFIEELFPYPPIEPASFLPKLLPLFPTHYHRYISKATNAAYLSPHLSLGEVILREHIIIRLPHSPSASYVEGVHHVNQPNSLSIRTQLWEYSDQLQNSTPHQHTPANVVNTRIPTHTITPNNSSSKTRLSHNQQSPSTHLSTPIHLPTLHLPHKLYRPFRWQHLYWCETSIRYFIPTSLP